MNNSKNTDDDGDNDNNEIRVTIGILRKIASGFSIILVTIAKNLVSMLPSDNIQKPGCDEQLRR